MSPPKPGCLAQIATWGERLGFLWQYGQGEALPTAVHWEWHPGATELAEQPVSFSGDG